MTYPSWRYHRSGERRMIHAAHQEHPDWTGTPADHGIETAPGEAPNPEIAARASVQDVSDMSSTDEPEAEQQTAAPAAPPRRARKGKK